MALSDSCRAFIANPGACITMAGGIIYNPHRHREFHTGRRGRPFWMKNVQRRSGFALNSFS